MPDAPSTLVEMLDARTAERPEQALYTFLGDRGPATSLGYARFRRRAVSIAARLVERGLAGERAILLYSPGLEYVAALWGCLYAGVVVVPAYPPDPMRIDRTLPRLCAIIRDARPAVVLTESMVESMIGMLPPNEDLEAATWLSTDQWQPVEGEAPVVPAVSGDRLALIQYTSGSTGSPKGVMLTHRALVSNIAVYSRYLGNVRGSNMAMWLPLYHDMGLIGGIFTSPFDGLNCVFMSPLTFLRRPLRWLEALSEYGATYTGAPNFAFDLAVRKTTPEQRAALDLSALRNACVGAEPTRPATLRRFAEAFADAGFRFEAFRSCYGLAETALFVCGGAAQRPLALARIDRAECESGRVRLAEDDGDPPTRELVGHGPCPPEHTVLIVDAEQGQVLPAGRIGEIWMAGPGLGRGYWARPDRSDEVYGARTVDGQGPLLRTGDLGFVHDDELYLTGRLKDLVIVRGRNLHPEDLEATVESAHPALRSGCTAAFSIEREDVEHLIVIQELDGKRASADPTAVVDNCWQAVRDAVTHTHGVAVDELCLIKARTIAKTSSGKVRRMACREAYLRGELEVIARRQRPPEAADGDDPATAQTPRAIEAWMVRWVARRIRRSEQQIDREAALTALGVDSLGLAALLFDVEERFDLVVTDFHRMGGELHTIAALARLLSAELAERASPGSGSDDG